MHAQQGNWDLGLVNTLSNNNVIPRVMTIIWLSKILGTTNKQKIGNNKQTKQICLITFPKRENAGWNVNPLEARENPKLHLI